MGKGIAYQFKLKFPENNRDYIKACHSGALKIGEIHHFEEKNKLIVNFPTKDEWRRKSKIEYIQKGLPKLVELVNSLDIKSISIPPLGCGNGGLNWLEVKEVIVSHLDSISDSVQIYLYEPSQSFKAKPIEVPKINFSHLVLMKLKLGLSTTKFNKTRLQKSAFFVNLYLGSKYFKFDKYKYGPYAHSIDILSKNIKEFQDYYNVDTAKASEIAFAITTSESVDKKINDFEGSIKKSTNLVNKIQNDNTLELISTICSILEDKDYLSVDDIYENLCSWSAEKAAKFTKNDVEDGINLLIQNQLVSKNLVGFFLDPI